MQKVIPSLPAGVLPKPLLERISAFLSSKGDADVLVPPLTAWAACQRELDYGLENAWMITDLLRAAMADRRVSGWFAIDGLDVISDLVNKVAATNESEWQLRVVTVQLVHTHKICANADYKYFFHAVVDNGEPPALLATVGGTVNLVDPIELDDVKAQSGEGSCSCTIQSLTLGSRGIHCPKRR